MTGVSINGLALVAGSLLAAGYLVVGLFWALPRTRGAAAQIWPVLWAESLVVGGVLLSFVLGGPVLLAALCAMAARLGYEAATVRCDPGTPRHVPLVWAGIAALGVLAVQAVPMAPETTVVTLGGCALACLGLALAGQGPAASRDLLMFPVLPMWIFALAAMTPGTAALILICYILIETFDSYALLAGKLFGRTRAFPRLSPNKTVEGLAGGAVMLLATSAGVAAFLPGVALRDALILSLLIGMGAVAGDLIASRMKRARGVKDFPTVLRAQGGLLDIFDSWVFTGAVITGLLSLTRGFG